MDLDSPPYNNRIKFRINNTVGPFVIDEDSGSISFTGAIDYEATKMISIPVTATDGGSPPLSQETYVALDICDSNDNTPIFSDTSYTQRISELTAPPAVVFTLTVTDEDSGRNGEFEVSITQAFPGTCLVSSNKFPLHTSLNTFHLVTLYC